MRLPLLACCCLALVGLQGCRSSGGYSDRVNASRSHTEAIRAAADRAEAKAPQVKPEADAIRSESRKVDEQTERLAADLEREKDSNRKRLMNLNASLFAVGIGGLVLSIIVGLWFRTKKAVAAAAGFAVLVAVTLAVSIFATWIAWIGLALLSVGAVGLGAWVYLDDRKERAATQKQV